jgi:hypothetical protein
LVDIRIYRGLFVLALLAFVVAMFSLSERQAPLSSTLAPDAFDDQAAYGVTRTIVSRHPDRRPGSGSDRAVADLVATRFANLGLETSRDEFEAEAEGENVGMTNVVGVLSGQSDRQLVVMAHRDSGDRPGASSASNTGVLLSLATALSAAHHDKTLVFVSTDGGAADSAGARRFAAHHPDRSKVESVLVLDDVAAAYPARPYLVPWSSGSGRSSLQLLRTADAALERELGTGSGSESVLGQFMRQAWPLTLREQGPLVREGMDAATLTSHGEVPRAGADDSLDDISRLRLLRSGKAALATLLAVDAADSLERSPSAYLVMGRNVLPGWSIGLLVLALLVPALAAALDGLARVRRRGGPVGHWVRWVLAVALPFVIVVLAARLFELLDWLPGTPSEALAPATQPSFGEAAPALGALILLFVFTWMAVRPRMAGGATKLDRHSAPEVAVVLTLVLFAELFLLWLRNPYATLLLVPVVHLSLLTSLPEGPNRRLLVISTVAAALLLPAIVLLYYGARLDMGADPVHYLLLLITGDGSLWSVLLGALIAGSLLSSVLISIARPTVGPEVEISVRGPRTYAGPGSLGGTESALRR